MLAPSKGHTCSVGLLGTPDGPVHLQHLLSFPWVVPTIIRLGLLSLRFFFLAALLFHLELSITSLSPFI